MATTMGASGAQARPLLLCTGRCSSPPEADLAVAQLIPVTSPESCPGSTGATSSEMPSSLHAPALQAGQ